jgi:hypothetical protein
VLNVTGIRVASWSLDHMDIWWQTSTMPAPPTDSTPHQVFDYAFYVLRSEAQQGPYDQIGGPFRDTYQFRDVQVSLRHRWRQFFYKIKVVHLPTNDTALFGPVSYLEPELDLVGAEIMTQEDILFRNFVGRKCILYPIRTFGPRCSCYDPVRGTLTRSGHLPCFGTGWLGGYLSPVVIYPQIDPVKKSVQLSGPAGKSQTQNTTARMVAVVPVSPEDVIIESENIRWRVVESTPSERLRSKIRHELVLHAIPKGDIEYALPIKLDSQTFQASDVRNFSNPTNLESAEDSSVRQRTHVETVSPSIQASQRKQLLDGLEALAAANSAVAEALAQEPGIVLAGTTTALSNLNTAAAQLAAYIETLPDA